MIRRRPSSAGAPGRTASPATVRGRQIVVVKSILAGFLLPLSLAAQQPAPKPAPAPAEPPIGAVTPTSAAIRHAQDSMSQAEARRQIPVVGLTDAIQLALKAHPAIVAAEAGVDIAHSGQRVALASW